MIFFNNKVSDFLIEVNFPSTSMYLHVSVAIIISLYIQFMLKKKSVLEQIKAHDELIAIKTSIELNKKIKASNSMKNKKRI